MKKLGLLMIGCAGIATATGCVADSAEADVDQTQVAESELAASAQGADTNTIGAFHKIRLSNTNLCMRPLGGTTADGAPIELVDCNDPAQTALHWLLSRVGSVDWQVINLASGSCLYENISPPIGGAETIVQGGCFITGTNVPVSNALWRPTAVAGNARLQTRVGHRDTGFCLRVPGIPFPGIGVVTERCFNTPDQTFVVGVE